MLPRVQPKLNTSSRPAAAAENALMSVSPIAGNLPSPEDCLKAFPEFRGALSCGASASALAGGPPRGATALWPSGTGSQCGAARPTRHRAWPIPRPLSSRQLGRAVKRSPSPSLEDMVALCRTVFAILHKGYRIPHRGGAVRIEPAGLEIKSRSQEAAPACRRVDQETGDCTGAKCLWSLSPREARRRHFRARNPPSGRRWSATPSDPDVAAILARFSAVPNHRCAHCPGRPNESFWLAKALSPSEMATFLPCEVEPERRFG